jgi:endonuclease/exonuclease/phosphatase family metal-dependent hydrolase
MRRWVGALVGGVVVVGGVGVGAGVLVAQGADEPEPHGTYVVGQFNMAGGTTEHGAEPTAPADAFAEDVRDRKPVFVAMQETCRDWDERLEKRLPGYTVVFSPVRNLARNPGSPARCHHPTDFGNTLLVKDGMGFETRKPDVHQLGSTDGDEYREMACVRSAERRLVFCAAHLTPGEGKLLTSRQREVATVARVLRTKYDGDTVVLGGDINDLPSSGVLGRLYHRDYGQGARGALKDASGPCGDAVKPEKRASQLPRSRYVPCRSGEPTHSKGKLDYLFVSSSVRVVSNEQAYSAHSDHKQVWARIRVS